MVFSDSSGGQGIVEEIDFLCGTDSASYPIAQKVRNSNNWLSRAAFLIESANGNWQFDDRNNTDLPIGTTNIVLGQQDYTLDITHLKILKVEIMDSSGNWQVVRPINETDPDFQRVSTDTSTGVPLRYNKSSNSLFFYPTFNYNQTGGIRVYFQRDMGYFVTTDTAKIAGFNQQFHRLISFGASYDFCSIKQLPQTPQLLSKIQELEAGLMEFYSNRGMDEPPKIIPILTLSR